MTKLQTEIPEGMKLTGLSKRILERLESEGFAIYQMDGNDYQTMKQLIRVAGDVGYRIVDITRREKIYECLVENFENSGRFLIWDESAKEVR